MNDLPQDIPVTTAPVDPLDGWRALPARLDDPAQATQLSKRRAQSWGLVLEARRIPCRSERQGFGWQLLVPTEEFASALGELRQFEAENRGWPPPPPPPTSLIDNRLATLWVLILLGAFHDLTLHTIDLAGHQPVDWSALGNAHAGKILAGQWWRLITALTLHTGALHLMGNLLIGGIFIARLCRDLGSGLGWSLLLASGLLGNLVNAWLQAPDHRAVGASTAVFGAVGLLAALSLIRYRHNLRPRRRWPLPVAAAVGLLAMLGASGDNTDLGAHLFGFLVGLLLGVGVEHLLERYGRPGPRMNALLALGSAATVIGAWCAALTWGS